MERILIVASTATDFAGVLRRYLSARGFRTDVSSSLADIGQVHFADLPSLLLLELAELRRADRGVLKELAISHIPFVAYSTESVTRRDRIEALELGAVECLGKPLDPREIFLRARNLLACAAAGNLHPFMAGFPGNSAATVRLQRLLEDEERLWALMWIGVDNLVTFYQICGYEAGNEAIEVAASALDAGIRAAGRNADAAYWVGGEDFALFTVPERVAGLADAIFAYFDDHIQGVYSPAEREAGCLKAVDRRGMPYELPLLSLSIGVVSNERRRFSDAWQVRQVAQEVRTKARQTAGNSYYIDSRREG